MATTLWFEDSPQQPSPLATVTAPEQEGIIGDLGEILDDIGSVRTVDELEGYMRDALFNDLELNSVIDRVFSGTTLIFADDEREAIAPPGWDPEYVNVDWANHILAEE